MGSTTLDILVYVPHKFYERLTKPSEVELALKETCSSMLMHSMAIHGGSRMPSTQYSEDSSTVVGDTLTQEKAERAMIWRQGQEARDFANGMTFDLCGTA